MIDDIREWISDNLRYILLGLAVILVFVIIFCIVRLVGGSKKSGTDQQQVSQQNTPVDQETATEAEDASGQMTSAQTAPTAAASEDLVKDEPAVLALIKSYYDAAAAKDVGTLSQIVTPWDDSVQSTILSNDVIEAYNNLSTYSKKGLSEGSYVVYTYFDSKISGIDTLAPSLTRLYVITNEAGNLVISSDADQDPEIAAYIQSVSSDADVQALIADVQQQYREAVASDSALSEYVASLDGGSDTSSGEEDTQDEGSDTISGTEMTATASLNIRQEPSTEAAILGSVISGTNVKVLEDAGDGWVHISYDTTQGTVEGYVRLEYLTEANAAA